MMEAPNGKRIVPLKLSLEVARYKYENTNSITYMIMLKCCYIINNTNTGDTIYFASMIVTRQGTHKALVDAAKRQVIVSAFF